MSTVLDTVRNIANIRNIANKYGIPESIWKPILYSESGNNPNAITSNDKEYSVGLFQINLKAHPQYAKGDLTDPQYNSEVAFRDFIAPAYNYLLGQGVTDPKALAVGVYSGINPNTGKYYSSQYGGIRPAWTETTKTKFSNYYDKFLKGTTTGGLSESEAERIRNLYTSDIADKADIKKTDTGELGIIQNIVRIGVLLGLSILLILLLLSLLPKEVKQIV